MEAQQQNLQTMYYLHSRRLLYLSHIQKQTLINVLSIRHCIYGNEYELPHFPPLRKQQVRLTKFTSHRKKTGQKNQNY